MNIGSALTGNLAPVLLKIPPFVRHIPELGKVRLAWSAIEPFIPDASTDPAIHLMLRENIGGLFWAPDIAVSRRSIICAPADPRKATRLWEVAREAREAADLTLVLPNNAWHWHSLRERAISDGGFVTCSDVNPWSIIENGQEIITCFDVTEALPALGSLAGLSLWCLDEAMIWPGAADGDARGKAAALVINATCYRSPFTGEIIQANEAVGLLIEWRDIMRRNRSVTVCAGMAWWKRDRIADFFATADEHRPRPFFRRGAKAAIALARRHAGGIAVWSTRMPRQLERCAHKTGTVLYRVEDGFIRSAGLGSGMLPPASIIVDRAGIYYDPAKPSDLEILLSSHPLGTDLQARVRRLMDRVISRVSPNTRVVE
ncbi:capsular polysaccharide export protein, LipB/KpsS family [Asaia prunellae]|uniref:capsular polysaccharide export protein, LipB/KpsS family n=1 Tax=Asaia prunellae TaxID=610245 RepID=UPI000A8BA925|nr:hypothetical protein [Asaia prunellae]